jgi:hypothetical protein
LNDPRDDWRETESPEPLDAEANQFWYSLMSKIGVEPALNKMSGLEEAYEYQVAHDVEKENGPREASWQALDHLLRVLDERWAIANRDPAPDPTQTSEFEPLPRVVFFLGEGASVSSGMPPWHTLKERVVNTAVACFPGFVDEAWRKLADRLGLMDPNWGVPRRRAELIERATTDMLCGVAGRYDMVGQEILEAIVDAYESKNDVPGPRPQLGYELIAHLIKHDFCDHVVSFNIDELLDVAVQNELGTGRYERILSDERSPPSTTTRAGEAAHKIVKLNGSIGDRSSLRLTGREGGVLTPRKVSTLDTIIFGDDRPVHLVSLGYSWRDADFTSWICSRLDRISSLTIVTEEALVPPGLEKQLRNGRTEAGRVCFLSTQSMTRDDESILSIDHLLWLMWDRLCSQNKKILDSIPYMPAARHFILGNLFGPFLDFRGAMDGAFNNPHTAELRLAAEVLLHIIRARGMVNASSMADDERIQRYRTHASDAEFEHVIHSLLKEGANPEVPETYFSDAQDATDFCQHFTRMRFVWPNLLKPEIEDGFVSLRSVDFGEFLQQQIDLILKGPDIVISPQTDSDAGFRFQKPEPIRSFPILRRRSRRLLEEPWTHVFSISEAGEWMTRFPFEQMPKERCIFLISATLPLEDDWVRKAKIITPKLEEGFRKLGDAGISVHNAKLPWWQHNRHLTLTYDAATNRLGGGIFIRRPQLAVNVSPVYLYTPEDCAELMITFLSYLQRVLQWNVLQNALPFMVREAGENDTSGFVRHVLPAARLASNSIPVNRRERVLKAVEWVEKTKAHMWSPRGEGKAAS